MRFEISWSEPMHQLEWPKWANLALLGIVVTAVLTVVATINDIW
jgi:hypothetical protein